MGFRLAWLCVGFSVAADDLWYEGIDSIKVFEPRHSREFNWRRFYEEMRMDQFSDKRWAFLLTRGTHKADIGVGFYTSVYGVGNSRSDVKINSFYAKEGPVHALQNFWRSVEGVTTEKSVLWDTSQAAPVRRTHIGGDLYLAECDTCYSSGGYLADTKVAGRVLPRTQQQYFFRNNHLQQGVDTDGGVNFVFVGNSGNLTEQEDKAPKVSVVHQSECMAEKPFLVEENGEWSIAVPALHCALQGQAYDLDLERSIDMADVFVARKGDTATTINAGIQGKKALLLTPAVYGLEAPIRIQDDDFVVLGLGFATLVNHQESSALVVEAADVRVAGVFFDAGSTARSSPSLLKWSGERGFLYDVVTRVAATSYKREDFHAPCSSLPRTDVHVQIDGEGVVVDNSWIWHADHDDCQGASDEAFSGHGLLVNGADVTVYGLKVEHTMRTMVQWNGEGGKTYFYQSEFPYNQPTFGVDGYNSYRVAPDVKHHEAMGLGS
eukprot:TRINITY_DN7093_c0_g2_i8.p1 TRINITY_DN7093_c0_g2~~TRINITY_DN7093_c0_g2_i8.p1  ORF type:complete len:492 (-),score=86.80 TRINITY_DN7093_c0_g2_i8:121-1596(-)